MIDQLQNYFGMTYRQCARKTVFEMKKPIGAILFHCSKASNLDTKHQICPREPGIWCKFQTDKQNKTTYKDKTELPSAAKQLIKPIFIFLSNHELLKKMFAW